MNTTSTVTLTDHATSCDGPEAVQLFRLITLRSALKLELATGMRMSRHQTALAVAKTITGLKTNKREAHITAVESLIEKQRAKVTHIDERSIANA
jgi:hypothetical protein